VKISLLLINQLSAPHAGTAGSKLKDLEYGNKASSNIFHAHFSEEKISQ
jgi:hypothetical protein